MDFFHSPITERAIELAVDTLRRGWVSEGQQVRRFEAALGERLGLAHPVAVNSGTAALHLALDVAGVGAGDEVLIPPQTFVATGLAVLMARARPVFADVDPDTGELAVESVRERITARTRAVIPVHWGGYPCDLAALNRLAERHGLAVVEDAAHALGARFEGRPVGAVSRFACFSFQAIKHLTTGDGGVLCCLDEEDARTSRRRRWFGIDRETARPSLLGEREFDIVRLGYKYHMNDLAASVGLGNLESFEANLARRCEIAAYYRARLAEVPGLRLPRVEPGRTHAYWLFTVLVERRDDFVRKLAERGIPASVVHRRIDRFKLFGGTRNDLPGQAAFEARQVHLPIHPGLTPDDTRAVVEAVRSGW